MTPRGIRILRERLHLTQEVFARILGVSFATVNRWENGKTEPAGDYARVLKTLQHLTAPQGPGATIDWQRIGALSAMAAVAGFSPVLTLGAALGPVLISYLPSWSDTPVGENPLESSHAKQQKKQAPVKKRASSSAASITPHSESLAHARRGSSKQ